MEGPIRDRPKGRPLDVRIHFDSSAAQASNGLRRGTVVIDDLRTHDKILYTVLLVWNSALDEEFGGRKQHSTIKEWRKQA